MLKITTVYQGERRFAAGEGVARVVMDGSADSGGHGEAPTPKHVVLHGLAGCTGLDVAVMLERQGVRFADLTIDVEAEQTTAHPKVFSQIKVVFRVKAASADRPKIERAIELSSTRFCGVSAMLEQTARISRELVLEPLA